MQITLTSEDNANNVNQIVSLLFTFGNVNAQEKHGWETFIE